MTAFGNVSKQALTLSHTPSVENTNDRVFSATSRTRYNAEGNPLTEVQKQLISQ